ncbi:LD-carboxypeptidase [Streptomyces aculeolatus]
MSSRVTSDNHRCAGCAGVPALPPRLAPGDTLVVCTPSGPGAPIAAERFARGVRWLERAGFDVRVGGQAHATGYAAGSARERAEELNTALRDPEVRGIVTAIGGYNANGVLPYLDFAALADRPRVLLGYSDVTALLLAAYACSNVVTFHGPTLMPELAEYPAPLPYTEASLLGTLCRPDPPGGLTAPPDWTEELLRWDSEDVRPRRMREHPGWRWLSGGTGTGRLVGGNLDTLCALLGTPYAPCLRGAVLFWESCAESIAVIDRGLCQLDAAGGTAGLAGMVVGRSFRKGEEFERDLRALVAERYAGRGFPVLAGVDIGHTDPMLTLPIGVRARLDSGSSAFEVTDRAVR